MIIPQTPGKYPSVKTLVIILFVSFGQLIRALPAGAELSDGKNHTNDLQLCDPDVQIEIAKARKDWGHFDFYCEKGLVTQIFSRKNIFAEDSWAATVREHLGLFGITQKEFVYFPNEGRYYQLWHGLPINHRSFSWFHYPSDKKYAVYARTMRTPSWKLPSSKKPTLSRHDAEKKAAEAVKKRWKAKFQIKGSVLMVSDNPGLTCRESDPRILWIVFGEEETGTLECAVHEASDTCPIACARDLRYMERF